jgi:hypothetical protein
LSAAPDLDFDAVIEVLDRHGVRFIVVGGQAARAWGSPSLTQDFDAAYARDRDNIERLAAALRDLGAKLRVANVDEDLPFQLDADAIQAGLNFTFRTAVGDLDFLGMPAGVTGYDELEPNAATLEIGGHRVLVCALDDLIRMKAAAGRRKDQVELEILRALRDERDRRGMTEP